MIEVYKNTNRNYQRNGDITLTPLSCIFEMGLDGISQVELSHEYDDLGRWEYLVNDNVIAAPTPYSDKQLFRIYNRVKGDDEVTVYARHIYYDNLTNVLIDTRPTLKTGQEALNIIFSGTKFKGHSDITTVNTAYYVRKNIVAAIAGDDENSFINRWGGEMLYDNYDIYVMRQLGEDKGVRAEFGHNLTGIEENISTEETITRIIPVAYNGYTLEGSKPWVDSPKIGDYAEIKAGVIEFSEIKLQEDCSQDEKGYANLTELRKALVKACNDEFKKGIDEPTVNYTVNMVELAETVEYRDYKQLENVRIGDTITCKHRKIKVEAKARCIRLKWNCLTKENEEVELGNFLQTYFDKTSSSIQQATASIEGANSQALAAKEIAQGAAKEATEGAVVAQEAARAAQAAAGTATSRAAEAGRSAEEAANQVALAAAQAKEATSQAELSGKAAEAAAEEKKAAGEYAAQAAAKAKEALAASEVATTQATAAGQHEAAAVSQAKAAVIAKEAAEKAKTAAVAAQGAAETAQGEAEKAKTAAVAAQERAESAQGVAETAKAAAEAAAGTATTQAGIATTAKEAAEKAQTAAAAAQGAAETAQGEAEKAKTAAVTAQESTEAAKTKAQEAAQEAAGDKTAAQEAAGKAREAAGTATTQATAAATAAKTAAEGETGAKHYYEMTKELYEDASVQAGQSNEAWLDLSYINNCYLCE